MGVRHWKAVEELKVILRNVFNDVKRFCFGDAISPALFFEKSDFWKKMIKISIEILIDLISLQWWCVNASQRCYNGAQKHTLSRFLFLKKYLMRQYGVPELKVNQALICKRKLKMPQTFLLIHSQRRRHSWWNTL